MALDARQNEPVALRVRLLELQIAQLDTQVRSAQFAKGFPAIQGNGSNGWYYTEGSPNDTNRGIHDYGARARDGQCAQVR